jgi:hypothetical protein
MTKVVAEKKPRKKRESGLNKRALSEIKHLVPHFTSRQLAVRGQMSLEQAQKTCSYLKLKGFVKVVGYAKLEGLKGIPESLYGVTEAYEKARKKNPSLFEGLKVVPTPIEKAHKETEKQPVDLTLRHRQLCKKLDGVIEVVDSLTRMLHINAMRNSDELGPLREQLKSLKEIKIYETE